MVRGILAVPIALALLGRPLIAAEHPTGAEHPQAAKSEAAKGEHPQSATSEHPARGHEHPHAAAEHPAPAKEEHPAAGKPTQPTVPAPSKPAGCSCATAWQESCTCEGKVEDVCRCDRRAEHPHAVDGAGHEHPRGGAEHPTASGAAAGAASPEETATAYRRLLERLRETRTDATAGDVKGRLSPEMQRFMEKIEELRHKREPATGP